MKLADELLEMLFKNLDWLAGNNHINYTQMVKMIYDTTIILGVQHL